jgi:hypothetical protein
MINSDKPVVVGSTEMTVDSSGDLVNPVSHKPLKTAESLTELTLDSRLPDSVFTEMKYVHVTSPSGGGVHFLVLAYSRAMSVTALFGSYIHIHSAVGDLYLDGPIMTFHNSLRGFFERAGFATVPGQRRLQGAFDLIGLFNSIGNFEGWDTLYDKPPEIPTTFIADIRVLHSCEYAPTGGGVRDLCEEFDVPGARVVTHRGERWAEKYVQFDLV